MLKRIVILCLVSFIIYPVVSGVKLDKISKVQIFEGTDSCAFRDPAVLYEKGVFHLFFTYVEIEPDGSVYSYLAYSKSRNLRDWTKFKILTERNQNFNFSSPGNIIRYKNEWLLCLQTYPRPGQKNTDGLVYGDISARIFIMRSKNLNSWTTPELIKVKGDNVPEYKMGRMIDPYLLQDKDDPNKYWCFYKQNGVSYSYTTDFKSWTFVGNTIAGENACVLIDKDEYLLFHSPDNGIGMKRSKDLKKWYDWGNLIVLGQKEWEWAKGRITAGAVLDLRFVKGINAYVMFFHGSGPLTENEGDFDKNSSLGIAWSKDLITWEWPLETTNHSKSK